MVVGGDGFRKKKSLQEVITYFYIPGSIIPGL
jgi:hypothetical protein